MYVQLLSYNGQISPGKCLNIILYLLLCELQITSVACRVLCQLLVSYHFMNKSFEYITACFYDRVINCVARFYLHQSGCDDSPSADLPLVTPLRKLNYTIK